MSKIRKKIFKAMKFQILKSAKFYSSEIKQVYSSPTYRPNSRLSIATDSPTQDSIDCS